MHSIPGNSPTRSPSCSPRRNSNDSNQASAWAYHPLSKGYRAGQRHLLPLHLNRAAGPKFDGPAGLICDAKDCKGHSGRTVRKADKRNDQSGSPWAFPCQNQLHYQQAHERNRETNCDFERPTHGGILCRTFMSASKRMPYWGSWQESKSFLSFASRRIYTRNSTHIEHAKASNL